MPYKFERIELLPPSLDVRPQARVSRHREDLELADRALAALEELRQRTAAEHGALAHLRQPVHFGQAKAALTQIRDAVLQKLEFAEQGALHDPAWREIK